MTRFHDAILLASRNEMLTTTSSSIAAASSRMTACRAATARADDPLNEHRRVCDAIGAGNAESAREISADLVRHEIGVNAANVARRADSARPLA